MLIANKLMPQGRGLAPVLIKRAASASLDWDLRQKSRFDFIDSQGRQIGVFLPRGSAVRGGDVLVAEDGSLVRIEAAPQAVLRITVCPAHGSAFDLTRAAYHLGNRHVPIELQPDHLKIEPDHVLADMLRSMHLIVVTVDESFEPEGGAYGGHVTHDGHSHHGQVLVLAPDADPAHGHDHGHGHGAGHGTSCSHGHAHKHEPASVLVQSSSGPDPQTTHRHGPGCKHSH